MMPPEVEYLGHKISSKGLQPSEHKVAAITDAPAPRDVSELKSSLGMVNYYGKFFAPLYLLLRKETAW